MKKYNLQEWLESGVAEKYNLIADTQDEQDDDFGMIDNPYEKFFIYKYVKEVRNDSIWKKLGERGEKAKKEFGAKAEKYNSIKDPDSYSEMLQEIYKTLYYGTLLGDDKNKKFVYQKYWIASDAMTSVQGVLTVALKNFIDEERGEIKDEDKIKEKIFKHIQNMYKNFKNIVEKQKYWTKKFCVVVAADLSAEKLDKSFYELIDKYYPNNILGEFINRCFTVGNYCPVPIGFNAARAGVIKENKEYENYDYWDLTLMQIRKWYLEDDDEELKKLLHCTTFCEKVKNCKEWLSWIANGGKGKKAWRRFVDTLLMQDYVWNEDDGIDKDSKKYYQVKEFWPDHSWENPELPKDDEKIKKALKGISERIAARSHRIVEELKRKKIECH